MDAVVIGDVSSRTTAPETGRPSTRIEVIERMSSRRRWTPAQKQAMVEAAFGGSRTVRSVAHQFDVTTGLLYTWRRQLRGGLLDPLAPSTFARVEMAPAAPAPTRPAAGAGLIEVELPSGVRLRVDASVDEAALTRVLAALAR